MARILAADTSVVAAWDAGRTPEVRNFAASAAVRILAADTSAVAAWDAGRTPEVRNFAASAAVRILAAGRVTVVAAWEVASVVAHILAARTAIADFDSRSCPTDYAWAWRPETGVTDSMRGAGRGKLVRDEHHGARGLPLATVLVALCHPFAYFGEQPAFLMLTNPTCFFARQCCLQNISYAYSSSSSSYSSSYSPSSYSSSSYSSYSSSSSSSSSSSTMSIKP